MKPGKLKFTIKDTTGEAEVSPAGWKCDNHKILEFLNAAAPLPATECGEPFCLAFHEGVSLLEAEVLQEPEADPYPPS